MLKFSRIANYKTSKNMSPTVTIITTARRFDHQNHSSA